MAVTIEGWEKEWVKGSAGGARVLPRGGPGEQGDGDGHEMRGEGGRGVHQQYEILKP